MMYYCIYLLGLWEVLWIAIEKYFYFSWVNEFYYKKHSQVPFSLPSSREEEWRWGWFLQDFSTKDKNPFRNIENSIWALILNYKSWLTNLLYSRDFYIWELHFHLLSSRVFGIPFYRSNNIRNLWSPFYEDCFLSSNKNINWFLI